MQRAGEYSHFAPIEQGHPEGICLVAAGFEKDSIIVEQGIGRTAYGAVALDFKSAPIVDIVNTIHDRDVRTRWSDNHVAVVVQRPFDRAGLDSFHMKSTGSRYGEAASSSQPSVSANQVRGGKVPRARDDDVTANDERMNEHVGRESRTVR